MFFGLATEKDLNMDDLDVSKAFLHGQLIDTGNEIKVCLLKKAIYGLKQASRSWNKWIRSTLLSLGLKQSNHEFVFIIGLMVKKLIIAI